MKERIITASLTLFNMSGGHNRDYTGAKVLLFMLGMNNVGLPCCNEMT